jgi:uncharacterized membrane protein
MDDKDRLLPVDAVRGLAMFFIGVSHISFYLINDSGALASNLRGIGYVATPNFLLMSGLACGYQLAASPTTATALRILDRGLFAFLVGHLLVAGSLVYMVPPGTAFEHIVITDSIGVLLCLAPLLKRTAATRLLWMGAAVYLASTTLAFFWHPVSNAQVLLGALLFSINDGGMPDIGWVSPTLPYMGIFLFGVGLGKMISQCRRAGPTAAQALSMRLAVAGSGAVVLAMVLNVGRHFVKPFLMRNLVEKNWADVVLTTINIRHDSPPTLCYALFYGGIGVALVGYLGLLSQREPVSTPVRVVRLAAVIGRASFISYVLQQWLIDFTPIWVGFDSWLTPATAPVYLIINTVLMYWVASAWSRHKANRFMTFGLQRGSWPRPLPSAAATVLLLVVVMNLLALANAPKLTPNKLGLLPTNPYPWSPVKVADH